MQPPKFLGKIIYFFGYPIFKLLIRSTKRSYVVVLYHDQILVTKNWLGFQKKWRLPGGGVQTNEDSVVAACREVAEEVGIIAEVSQLQKLTASPVLSMHHYLYDIYLLPLTTMPQITPDKREILATQFVSKKDIENIPIGEELATALRLLDW